PLPFRSHHHFRSFLLLTASIIADILPFFKSFWRFLQVFRGILTLPPPTLPEGTASSFSKIVYFTY
ncbi:MAG: hypothetical protein II369_00505, partial [Clostridia bacterium]|nr:hypothetical protein [Clostridia bacterium]